MYLTTLRTVGGSVMFAIPKPILEGLGLTPDTQVGLTVTDGRIMIEPQARPRYTLAQLLAQCDMSVPATEDDEIWRDGDAIGREHI